MLLFLFLFFMVDRMFISIQINVHSVTTSPAFIHSAFLFSSVQFHTTLEVVLKFITLSFTNWLSGTIWMCFRNILYSKSIVWFGFFFNFRTKNTKFELLIIMNSIKEYKHTVERQKIVTGLKKHCCHPVAWVVVIIIVICVFVVIIYCYCCCCCFHF